jgi:hypothetical protein
MWEIRLLRGRLPRKGGGLTGMTITCNNPGFTFYYMIILFPINCLPDTTSVLKGQANKCDSQSEI